MEIVLERNELEYRVCKLVSFSSLSLRIFQDDNGPYYIFVGDELSTSSAGHDMIWI